MKHAKDVFLFAPKDEQEVKEAAITSRQIAGIMGSGKTATLMLVDGKKNIKLPFSALHMLQDILTTMAKGDAVSIIPIRAELTTQQAADFLNVSRPYFVKLLKTGELEYKSVGRHRRVMFKELLEYKAKMEEKQNAALDSLVEQAQKLNMGY